MIFYNESDCDALYLDDEYDERKKTVVLYF